MRSFHVIFAIELAKCPHNSHCGNYGNLLSLILGKNSVKATFLLKKVLNSCFGEILFDKSKFLIFPQCDCHSVENEKFTAKQIFFVKSIYIKVL